ncbi:MAG TPA: MaoC family dehydratase N-terminal domain-containing protein [Dehalococcoidia bacterium]|nr:MaoC family dehydratase N-terminal domain-containing protein [Dehalococcoidia bacterium]
MTAATASLIAEGEVEIGLHLGRHEYEVTPELVEKYAQAVGDDNEWYRSGSPFGGPVAPALIMHSEVYNFPGWYLRNIVGNLHAKQEWELFNPILVGERITTASNVIDRYLKRGRDFVVNEVTVLHEDGRLAARSRTHQSFLLDRPDGIVVDKEREKKLRGIEREMPPVIESLSGPVKSVDEEMCWKYSGPARNYHNDREFAQKLGFPDIVVQGTMSTCFISELMTRRFGEGWFKGGRMSLNLINVLWVNEQVQTCGEVNELTLEGSRQRAHVTVWTQKPDGTKTIAGTASALA